jgi:hypothetical protein
LRAPIRPTREPRRLLNSVARGTARARLNQGRLDKGSREHQETSIHGRVNPPAARDGGRGERGRAQQKATNLGRTGGRGQAEALAAGRALPLTRRLCVPLSLPPLSLSRPRRRREKGVKQGLKARPFRWCRRLVRPERSRAAVEGQASVGPSRRTTGVGGLMREKPGEVFRERSKM